MPTFSQPLPVARLGAQDALSQQVLRARREADVESYGAVISRQFSLWPFGTRVLRLYMLADPSEADARLVNGLLRAMQQEYFRSETRSQTNALRGAVRAVHHALRHRNEASLPHERVTAASACAVSRGGTAYVALAGDAAALTWDGAILQLHRGTPRAARPLGAETALPRVSLWSTPLGENDQLILACGTAWHDDTLKAAEAVLRGSSGEQAARDLAHVLGGAHGLARVLVADGVPDVRSRFPFGRHRDRGALGSPSSVSYERSVDEARDDEPLRTRRSGARRAALAPTVALAGAMVVAAVTAVGARTLPPERSPLQAASSLLGLVRVEAHVPGSAAPVALLSPSLVADLGSHASSVIDLAISDTEAFVLDGADQSVRRFSLAVPGQGLSPDSLVARAESAIGGRTMSAPVALALSHGNGQAAVVSIFEQRRRALQVSADGAVHWSTPASTAHWKSVTSAAAAGDTLYVLDGAGGALQAFDHASQGLGSARVVLDNQTAPSVPFASTVDLAVLDDLYFLQQDGLVRRFDQQGREKLFDLRGLSSPVGRVTSIAAGSDEDLYLADPENNRVLRVAVDGQLMGEVRAAREGDFADLWQIELAPDGTCLYAVTDAGLVAVPLPASANVRN